MGLEGRLEHVPFTPMTKNEPKELGSGSLTKVAISDDTILSVVDALPGRLDPNLTWPLVIRYADRGRGPPGPNGRQPVHSGCRRMPPGGSLNMENVFGRGTVL